MRRYGYLLVAGLFCLWGCNEFRTAKDAKKDITPLPEDNYIILLDLSDRILFNNQQQVSKDIAVIKSIYGIFKANLALKDSTHEYYGVNDKLKLLEVPHWYHAGIDLSAEQPDKKASLPDKTEKSFNTLLPAIYKGTILNHESTGANSADIWKYFNEYLTDDLDKKGQNTLFVITDGYMDLGKKEERPAEKNRYATCSQVIGALKNYPDWEARFTEGDYGLLSIPKKFTNLRVIVLQVNAKEGWSNEYALLTKIWSKWLTEMGISNYNFIKNDTISEVTALLEKSMGVKINATTTTAEQSAKSTATDSSSAGSAVTAKEKNNKPVLFPAAPEKKTMDTAKKTAPVTREVLQPDESKTKLLTNIKPGNTPKNTPPKELPVTTKEKNNITASPPPAPVKKTTDATKKTEAVNHEKPLPERAAVSPQQNKKNNTAAKKTATSNDDILKDNGAANGFNTGIKKTTKKKNR